MVSYPPFPPSMTLSTRTSRLVNVETFFQAARASRIDGIDVDLSRRPRLPKAEAIASASRNYEIAVRSFWMPRVSTGPIGRRRYDQSIELAAALAETTDVTAVLIDAPPLSGPGASLAAVVGGVQELQRQIGWLVRVTVALRPYHLDGHPEHLARLMALRRTAEEWDFDLALDLLGPIDRAWEAEAAVTRLLPRLSVIRVGSPVSRPPGRSRAIMTSRVLATIADGGFCGEMALAPSLPALCSVWPPVLTRACAIASDQIRARFLTLDEQFYFGSSLESRPQR